MNNRDKWQERESEKCVLAAQPDDDDDDNDDDTHTHTHTHTHIYIYMYVCMYITYTHHIHVQVHTQVYIHKYVVIFRQKAAKRHNKLAPGDSDFRAVPLHSNIRG